jgi:hypothetical protein
MKLQIPQIHPTKPVVEHAANREGGRYATCIKKHLQRLGVLIAFLFVANIGRAQTLSFNTPATSPATYTAGGTIAVSVEAVPVLLGSVTSIIFTLPPLTQVTGMQTFLTNTFTGSFTATMAPGTYTLTATLNSKNLAGTVLTPVVKTVTIIIAPPAPTAPAVSTCPGSTATINVSGGTPTGGTYSLYAAATGGMALATTTGSTLVTPMITTATTYYVAYTSNGIESATRTAVNITLNAAPAAATFTALPAAVAIGANATITFTSTPVAGVTYAWDTHGGTPATKTGTATFTVNWADAGAKLITLTATSTATGCTTVSTQIVTVTKTIASGNYAFNQPITLSTNLMGISTTLTNFPVLVYIKEDALKTGVNCANNIQFPTGGANGYDFAFTTSAGTDELFYQVESFTPATGELLAWVQVPSITNAATSLKFYFGSAAPGHPTSFENATWSSDYLSVYHFNEGTGTIIDATAYLRTGTATSAATTAGKITAAYTFNGTSTKIVSNTTTNITGPFTLSAWAYVTDFNTSADQKILTNEASYSTGGYKLGYYGPLSTTVKAELETRTATGTLSINRAATGGTNVTTGAWHYVQGVYDGTNLISYYDGVADRSATGAAAAAGGPVYIGSDFAAANWFYGKMDEVRISNTTKSADWIKAEFYNQNNYLTFTNSTAAIVADPTNAKAIGGSLVYTWTGTAGTATNTAGNWKSPASGNPVAAAAPPIDGTASLNIPSVGVTNFPVLAGAASYYGITIASGATFNLNGNTLTVGCNVYNSGVMNAAGVTNTSTIVWNGIFTPQLYTGNNSLSTAQFGNFTVNNTAASGLVRITGGPIDLYNTLTLTSGSLVVDNTGLGALTLKSSATFTARVAEITSSARSITGNVTVERWFTGGSSTNRGWRLMSSPVNNSGTLPASSSATYNFASYKTNLPVTGPGGTGNGFDTATGYTANGPTVLLYDTPTFFFSSPATLTSTTKVGSGFYFYFRGNRNSLVNKLVRPFNNPEANVVGLQTGTLNQQSFSYPLSNAGRHYNQVGNPYPSSISISSSNMTGTTGFIYTYLSSGNSISPQIGATTIASGQGFYVIANSPSGAINFTESLKVTTQPTGAALLMGMPVETQEPTILLKLTKDSANYDITYVRFLDTYNKDYNEMEDADDFNGPGQAVLFSALTADNHLVAIASQPLLDPKTSIFLSVDGSTSGIYTIQKMSMVEIPEVYDVWLMDHFKSDSLDLRGNGTYAFNIDKANAETYGNSRFELVIRKKTLPEYKLLSFKAQKNSSEVMLKWNTLNEYDYTSFELQKSADGKNFDAVKNMRSSSKGSYSYRDTYAGTKDVFYRLKQVDINNKVSYSEVIIISTQGDGATLSIFPNPASNVIQFRLKNDVKTSVRLRIYNSMGILVKNSSFTNYTGQQDISSLIPGTYSIELTDLNSKKIILTGKFVKI